MSRTVTLPASAGDGGMAFDTVIAGGWGEDVLEEARQIIVACMRQPGRNAMVQLAAAKTILAKDFLSHLPDEQLVAEVERRAGLRR